MNNIVDGVKVFDGYVYFDHWLEVNGYHSKSEIRESMLIDGHSEEEVSEELDGIYDEFCEWADENDLSPQYV